MKAHERALRRLQRCDPFQRLYQAGQEPGHSQVGAGEDEEFIGASVQADLPGCVAKRTRIVQVQRPVPGDPLAGHLQPHGGEARPLSRRGQLLLNEQGRRLGLQRQESSRWSYHTAGSVCSQGQSHQQPKIQYRWRRGDQHDQHPTHPRDSGSHLLPPV